jgi:hypothetical protein
MYYAHIVPLGEVIMWRRIAFAITVVLLGFSGGVLALFVRGMHSDRGAVVGFCLVCAVAIVQAWMVASEIAKARRLRSSIRNACYRGAYAKFRAVSLVGLCAIVGVIPMILIAEDSGAPARQPVKADTTNGVLPNRCQRDEMGQQTRCDALRADGSASGSISSRCRSASVFIKPFST